MTTDDSWSRGLEERGDQLRREFRGVPDREGVTFEELTHRRSKPAKWQCEACDYEWEAWPTRRVVKGVGCARCAQLAKRLPAAGESLADERPDLVHEFVRNLDHPDQGPTRLKLQAGDLCVWRCPVGCGDYEAHVYSRTRPRASGCQRCALKGVADLKRTPGAGESLQELHEGIAKEFVRNLTRPGATTRDVKPGSRDRCVWKCGNCGARYEATVGHRSLRGAGCRAC